MKLSKAAKRRQRLRNKLLRLEKGIGVTANANETGIDPEITNETEKNISSESNLIANRNKSISDNENDAGENNLNSSIIDDKSLPKHLLKYYKQRYSLFHKYDLGIKINYHGWYSVTPEEIAKYIAQKVKRNQNTIVIDAFCGNGGNAIQFELLGFSVIAIDICKETIKVAKHNANIYGCKNIKFINADFMELEFKNKKLPVDGDMIDINDCVVFLSPPWGGVSYNTKQKLQLSDLPINGNEIYEKASRITNNIVYFLPRNIDINQTVSLGNNVVEADRVYLDGYDKGWCVYYYNDNENQE